MWYYPYKRLAFSLQGGELEERFTMPLHCQSPKVSSSQATKLQLELRSLITNGNQAKYLFDCKRGMMSAPLLGDKDTAKALMVPIGAGFMRDYVAVCSKVMHEAPFLP